jgi:hypothetical protein
VEHDQHTHPRDFARHLEVGAIASVQPYHAIDDGRFVEKRIGRRRCMTTYAFRTFLDLGIHMNFGSDWSVAPLDPILGIDAAVNRATLDGKNPEGWFPEQKIGVAEAVRAYTLENAYAAFMGRTGSITRQVRRPRARPGPVPHLAFPDQGTEGRSHRPGRQGRSRAREAVNPARPFLDCRRKSDQAFLPYRGSANAFPARVVAVARRWVSRYLERSGVAPGSPAA